MKAIALSFARARINLTLQHLDLALVGVLVVVTAALPVTAAATDVAVAVTRRDLRPLPGVTLQLAGAANVQGVTDDNGRVTFLGLAPAGIVTLTPSRSGFRFVWKIWRPRPYSILETTVNGVQRRTELIRDSAFRVKLS